MFKILPFIYFILITWPTISYCTTSASIRIVENGTPLASIVIASDASGQVRAAAGTLQEYIQKSSRAKLPIVKSSELPLIDKQTHIWVGFSEQALNLQSAIEGMDDDGFVISFPSSHDIIIIGPTDWGTEFGVYEFLTRYVGVRWLMPGPDGEHVPEVNTIDIPLQEVRQEPVFFSRLLSGLPNNTQKTWARRNRMHGRVKFHHNLIKLFPPEQYTKTHPEFFPIHKEIPLLPGKRFLPPDNKTHKWQPCFTAPGLVDAAVRNICAYFEKHPKATSYSLGVNDGSGHCECDQCQIKDNGKKNFLGRTNVSNRYFEWANAVVEGVLKKYPNKWFGCLAYSEIAEPPNKINIHPRIIPYLTYDRMKWVDKNIELKGYEITERWTQKASHIGWYDYIYGTPYMVPRVYFHKMADYYKYAATHGVNAMYAESYPNWGEGPKLYVALKLQWNPQLDVDVLLKDWFVNAVGEQSAFDLAAYYAHWEQFWTNRIVKSKWFRRGGQYLRFKNPGYLDSVNYVDIVKSRKLLESVVNQTKTSQQQARAKLILKAFEYYEASVFSYLGLMEQKDILGLDKGFFPDMGRKRYRLINDFQKNNVLIHPLRFNEKRFKKRLEW